MRTKIKSMIAVAALAFTGCAGIGTQPSLSHSSPASPNAPEASCPAAAPVLMTGTNFAMNPPAETEQPPDHNKMEMPNHDKMDMPMKH
jgi:hypothetical protein